jgi:hypothetical protein
MPAFFCNALESIVSIGLNCISFILNVNIQKLFCHLPKLLISFLGLEKLEK